jgi:4-hydroxybenzoate polyprenyltransferase
VRKARIKTDVLNKLPLAVDLDGSLVCCDLFVESLLRVFFSKPWKVPLVAVWLLKGRAYAKARLAKDFPPDPADLPYDGRLLDWLRAERAGGRTLVLATASDQYAARLVADHLGLFDRVFASNGQVNLKSAQKADLLAAAFPDGFVYAGNAAADMAVWRRADAAVLINLSGDLLRRAEDTFEVERKFAPIGSTASSLIKAIRPQQWAKNVLVFLPMLVGQAWSNLAAWEGALGAFWALCFTASSVYLLNDAADIDADRRHLRKRFRPFASGALSPAVGLSVGVVLVGLGFALGTVVHVVALLCIYLAATTLYSFWLKRVVLVDVFLLAGLYTIRVVIGGVASGIVVSDWLMAFCCFFFLSLALAKRVAEVDALEARGGGVLSRRGYFGSDGTILRMMGVGAGFVAALVLALYLQDSSNAARYREPFLLWVLPAVVLFWLCRLWLMADRGEMQEDPLVFAFGDKTSWAAALFIAAAFAAAVLMPWGLRPW